MQSKRKEKESEAVSETKRKYTGVDSQSSRSR